MTTQAKTHAFFNDSLRASVGQLLERAATAAPGAERSRLMRWVLVALAVFVAWRFARGLKKLFWTAFGIGMALWWSGGSLFFLR